MIRSVLLKKCYNKLKANLYLNELNSRGIYTFIQNEHVTDMIPFGDGGYELHVDIDKLDEALTIIEKMDSNYKEEEDFREATKEDIEYEKLKTDRAKAQNRKSVWTYIILGIAILLLLFVFLNRNEIL